MTQFDDSLPILIESVLENLGFEGLEDGVFLRDPLGRVAYIPTKDLDTTATDNLQSAVLRLGPYALPQIGAVVPRSELADERFFYRTRPFVTVASGILVTVRLADQRIIGQDWNALPHSGWRAPGPARFVFWSLKGGVGRTTAISVAATHLARLGKRVLVVDLDLEAPGLGSVLLRADEIPEIGTVDWFVENGIGSIDTALIERLVSPSSVATGSGILHVAPAVGRSTIDHPENLIAKLGRAYLEDVDQSGMTTSFLEQVQLLLSTLENAHGYDVIICDARAGLNEATASALLGLGADVLMLGENTPQTFAGFRFLLAHLRGLPFAADDDWRLRLKMVYAKATPERIKLFNDRSFELFQQFLYEEERSIENAFNYDLDDPDAPHVPWVIGDDSNFREFNPLEEQNQLSDRYYTATFGSLIDGLLERIGDDQADDD